MMDVPPLAGLLTFPIAGNAVGQIVKMFPLELTWSVEDLESICSDPAKPLVSLLAALTTGPVYLSTTKLSEAIASADQVVTLIARVKGNEETAILVEDGDLITIAIAARPLA